ncbi:MULTISPECIES: chaplin [unclassified Streptomyces]|uniref:chaplin n=1 Tax=unclassified Streptomyces TaxID=2593676 RepID=UPI003648D646
MRQVHRKGLTTVMLTGGALAMATGYAQADSSASGGASNSPGVLSGNAVQIPVNVPVNVCGNTVDVVGLLNPAAGNRCSNDSSGAAASGGSRAGVAHQGGTRAPGTLADGGGARADGAAENSPGVLSGNGVQLPVDLPLNVSGNSVNVVGIGNPAVGNSSENVSGKPPVTPPRTVPPQTEPPLGESGTRGPSLAQTGSDALAFAVPAGATMLLGGLVLYRRFRPAQQSARA